MYFLCFLSKSLSDFAFMTKSPLLIRDFSGFYHFFLVLKVISMLSQRCLKFLLRDSYFAPFGFFLSFLISLFFVLTFCSNCSNFVLKKLEHLLYTISVSLFILYLLLSYHYLFCSICSNFFL